MMIWKVIIIILCILWCLPMIYVWHKTKWLKRYEDDLDNQSDHYDASIRAYHLAVADVTKEFNRIDNAIDDQRKIVNGWQHKIDIMDRDIRKLKDISKKVTDDV